MLYSSRCLWRKWQGNTRVWECPVATMNGEWEAHSYLSTHNQSQCPFTNRAGRSFRISKFEVILAVSNRPLLHYSHGLFSSRTRPSPASVHALNHKPHVYSLSSSIWATWITDMMTRLVPNKQTRFPTKTWRRPPKPPARARQLGIAPLLLLAAPSSRMISAYCGLATILPALPK
jgi:hypothetical protein